jgi:hypothetical protein
MQIVRKYRIFKFLMFATVHDKMLRIMTKLS